MGVAHPPGYPLFAVLGRIFMSVFRFFGCTNGPWSVNVLNALLTTVATLALCAATWRVMHAKNWFWGFIVAWAYAFRFMTPTCVVLFHRRSVGHFLLSTVTLS